VGWTGPRDRLNVVERKILALFGNLTPITHSLRSVMCNRCSAAHRCATKFSPLIIIMNNEYI
jgi:hypothetical protein